ncbi:MAG: hypothetical protein ACXVXX_01725 [Blastococcus sp.]
MTAAETRRDRPTDGQASASEPARDGRPATVRTPQERPADPHPSEPSAADEVGLGAVEALPRLLKAGGAVVGPATLITALLIQFGRLWAAGYFRYFGVNFSVLDLTTNDFLTSGADGLWVPVAAASVAALVVIWAHRLLLARLTGPARRRAFRVLIPASGVIGGLLVTLALLDLVGHIRPFWSDTAEAGGLSLALGALLLVYAVRLVRLAPHVAPPQGRDGGAAHRHAASAGLAEWGAAFLLVSVGLFWAVGNYAFGVGVGRAQELDAALPALPDAVLYSEKSLGLDLPGVTELRCRHPDAAYLFRYEGLRLVREAGNQYLMLPAAWTRPTGTAVLIPRSAAVRLEFRTAAQGSPTC